MELKQARENQKTLEVKVMKMIRAFEKEMGCVISEAKMTTFADTRFFATMAYLGRELKKRGED